MIYLAYVWIVSAIWRSITGRALFEDVETTEGVSIRLAHCQLL